MKTLLALLITITSLQGVEARTHKNTERALIAYMRVVPGTEKQFLKEAEDVIRESRRETGNITYQLHQSVTNPQQFVFYELFESDEDLQYHRNAPHTKAFLKITKPYTLQFSLEEYVPEGEVQ